MKQPKLYAGRRFSMNKYEYIAFFTHDEKELPLSLESLQSIAQHVGVSKQAIAKRFSKNKIIKHGSLSFERVPKYKEEK